MPTFTSIRKACLLAVCAALLSACGGSTQNTSQPAPARSEPPPAPPPPPLPSWVAERCSVEPSESVTNPAFSEAEARQALASARTLANACQAGAAPVGVELIWGPSGCVRSVELQSRPADPSVTTCMLNAFQAAGVPPFSGGAVRLLAQPDSRLDVFSRVGVLEHDKIESVVRSHQNQFRKCFLEGYKRNPGLRGTVHVRFVIPESGTVTQVASGGTDLPDQRVVACVLQRFVGMRFPAPRGGPVRAVYPVVLRPGV